MNRIKTLGLFVVYFCCFIAKGQDVEKLNIGILPVSSSVAISNEQLKTIQNKLSKAFVNKIRFTVFEGDSLIRKLTLDSITSISTETNKDKNNQNSNLNKINYIVIVYVNVLRSLNTSIPNSSGGYDKGVNATTAMKIKILDLKTNKIIFDEALYHSETYKNSSILEASNRSIYSFCELFKDLVNYVFPVELSINTIETSSKKGIAETVTIKNAEYMYVYIKKGFLDYPNSEFEVFIINEAGNKEIIGKLEAKEINDLNLICEVDKGAKDISKKIQEGKTLYLKILNNTIEYYINQRKK